MNRDHSLNIHSIFFFFYVYILYKKYVNKTNTTLSFSESNLLQGALELCKTDRFHYKFICIFISVGPFLHFTL